MLAINFRKVILHNFGSYTHAELDLQDRGFCSVTGENHCVFDNAASNGSGKSMIWNGICYALTGQTIKGVSKNLKNTLVEDPEMYAEVSFRLDNHEYCIRRGQSPSKYIKIVKDDVDISGKTLTESVAKLADELPDLTGDLIASCLILGQGMPNKFSSFSPSGRKDLLEKLTKSSYMIEDVKTRIGGRLTTLSEQVRAFDDALLVNNTKLSTVTANISSLTAQINLAVKPDYATEIAKSEALITEIKTAEATVIEAMNKAVEAYDAAQAVLLAITTEKAAQSTSMTESYHASIDGYNIQKTQLTTEISGLNREITKLESIKDVCPTCGHKLEGVTKPSTTEQRARVAELTETLANVTAKIDECNSKFKAYTAQINNEFEESLKTANATVNAHKQDASRLRGEADTYHQKAEAEKAKLAKLRYDEQNWDSWYAGMLTSKAGLEQEQAEILKNIKKVEDSKADITEHLATIKKVDTLVKRDFRGYLLSNIIAYINAKAKEYSEIVFGTRDLELCLDGNALDISYHGKMIDNLSGGELTRVDLILQLAIRNTLMTYLGFDSNIIVLDEITDFLDKKSCAAVLDLLNKELNTIESVFIISHHADELELPIDSEVKVIKNSEGISSIR